VANEGRYLVGPTRLTSKSSNKGRTSHSRRLVVGSTTLWVCGESSDRSRCDRSHEETIINPIRKTLTATAVVGAVLAGAAACGTVEQLSAGKKLDRAFDKLGKKNTLSFELDLDTDVASLKALDAKSDPAPGEEIPDEVAELLSGAKITVTVQSKKPLDESGEKDLVGTAMKVSTPDGDLAEYRVIGDSAYIRADLDAMGKVMGSPLPDADDLPPEAGALKDVIEGKWVQFSTKEMNEAVAEDQEAEGGPAPAPSLDAATQKKLVKALREVVARDVKFKTAGGSDGTEHVTATAPFRTLITDLFGEIRPLVKDLPPGMGLPTDKDLKEAPDAKVTADFTLKNGELSQVDVDLAKLAESAKVKKLGLTVRLREGAKPTAPAGATKLDLNELMNGFFGAPVLNDAEFGESGPRDEDFPMDEM
jgi:CDGSH-type Zn-finger protein